LRNTSECTERLWA